MAEQATLGIKMDTDRKNDWQQRIAASGMTAAEYLDAMAAAYEATQARETLIDDRELRLIDSHLARIGEIAIGIAKARKDEGESAGAVIADLQVQLQAAKAEIVDTREVARQEVAKITEQMAELEFERDRIKNQADNEILDAVNAKVKAEEDGAQARRMFETLTTVNQQLQQQAEESRAELRTAKTALETANTAAGQAQTEKADAEAAAADLRRQLTIEQENSTRVIAELKQQYEFEKRQAILDARAEAMEQRHGMMDELEVLRKEMLKLRTEK